MDLKALPILRKNLRVFIQADKRSIVLSRVPKVPSDNGSWTEGDPIDLPPQDFRLVPMKRRLSGLEVDTQDGHIPIGDWVLVGEVTCDIQDDDEFILNGDLYKVVGVEPKANDRDKSDRLVIQVTMHGKRHLGDGTPG